ncbi:MAG: hypothetical protein RMJ88_00565 [Thermogemmata sp.]|nr:hypothetical protein [Thermogemmata sp.]
MRWGRWLLRLFGLGLLMGSLVVAYWTHDWWWFQLPWVSPESPVHAQEGEAESDPIVPDRIKLSPQCSRIWACEPRRSRLGRIGVLY